jgi:hypothetical protein
VTDNATGDAPMLPCLLDQIAESETIMSVSGDGAYDTKGFHEAIARRRAQAIILLAGAPSRGKIDARRRCPQCHPGCPSAPGAENLESMDGLSPTPCRNKDALFLAAVNGSWRVTSTAKLQSCRCVPLFSVDLRDWILPFNQHFLCLRSDVIEQFAATGPSFRWTKACLPAIVMEV